MPLPERKKDKKVTYQDYLTWPDANVGKFIHGEAWAMTPAPSTRHQKIVGRLFARLAQRFSGGPCVPFVSPIDVVLDETNIVSRISSWSATRSLLPRPTFRVPRTW